MQLDPSPCLALAQCAMHIHTHTHKCIIYICAYTYKTTCTCVHAIVTHFVDNVQRGAAGDVVVAFCGVTLSVLRRVQLVGADNMLLLPQTCTRSTSTGRYAAKDKLNVVAHYSTTPLRYVSLLLLLLLALSAHHIGANPCHTGHLHIVRHCS